MEGGDLVMSGVDNRIVTMKFDNREFERNAQTSISTLAKVKESLNFGSVAGTTIRALGMIESALSKIGLRTPFAPMIKAANVGLSGIGIVLDKLGLKNPFSSGVQGASELQRAAQAAGGPQGMGVLEGGVTAVSSKFIALTTIAVTALSNITNRAINAGTTFAKSFTFQPVLDGLHEYELNLKSIQTIQANTDQPLDKITASLDELNRYSDETIYNFSEMARNVGTFTAAGVDLQTSVSAIKGIANLAALSGSSSEQAASAMYQLSQAIAAGRVGLMDWNSVVNAGMGGKKLQNALAQTAIAMGQISANEVKMEGPMKRLTIQGQSFRESIMAQPGQESWLTSDILVNTLATMDGRFSALALSQEKTETGLRKYTKAQIQARIEDSRAALEKKNGVKFTDEQFKALQKMSTQAFKSATQVKTLGQVFDVAKETIGSGWSASFRNIFGNLNQAKKLFTGMSNTLNGIINQNALARNKLLNAWSKGGGRNAVIEGLKAAWEAVYSVIQAVGKGFRDIFPKNTARDLITMSQGFADLMKSLIPSKKTLGEIRDIAGGVFAIFGVGKQILGGVVTFFKTLFGAIGAGNGDFLGFVANIGNMIKDFNDFLQKSGLITAFFTSLGNIVAVPLALLRGLGDVVGAIFGGFDSGAAAKVGDAVGAVGDRLSGLEIIGLRIRDFFVNIGDLFGNIGKVIGKSLVGIGDMVAGMFTADTFDSTLDVINTTLLGAIVLLIKNFFTKGVKVDLTGGLFDGIKESLGAATGAFQNMQNTLKADILLKLAGAIAVMAAALMVLSMIDPGALTKALAAMSAGFGILTGAMVVLMKSMGATGLVQLYVVTSAMTKMAASILLLSFALKTLSGIKFSDMLRGLIGLAAMMFILQKAMLPLAAGSKGMGRAAWSLIAVGVALNILAVALKIFASMSWGEMIKGLAGLTGVLLALSIGLKMMPPLKAEALGLIALGLALNMIAIAMKIFATMSWEDMAKGLVAIGGALLLISLAINTMPKTMLLQATALVAVAGAMVVLAGAMKLFGSMGWAEIAKGLVMLGGSLLIIAVGLQAIGVVGTVGAVGLLATAAALSILAPVMLAFGAMKWSTILKSLTMLAGIFVVLGAAGYLLAPVVPVILGLGAALLLMGAGLALAGAGALAAAMAFGIVVAAGSAGIQILVGLLGAIIAAIPPALKAFGEGVVQFAVAIGQGAPAIAKAFGQILTNMLNQVIKNAPKVAKAFLAMLNAALRVIVQASPRIANAGLKLIVGFLRAISNNIGKIVNIAADIIVKFLNGIARNIGRVIQAGVNLVLKFMEGVAKAIRNNSAEFGRRGADIGIAIVEGTVKGLAGAGGAIKDKLISLGKEAWEGVKHFFGIGSPSKLMRDTVGKWLPHGMAKGIESEADIPVKALETMGRTAMDTLQTTMSNLSDAFAMSTDLNPTVTPVLDLSRMTREANRMSAILATAPIVAGVSYQTAADISAMTSPSNEGGGNDGGSDGGGNGGPGDVNLTLELHSPKPIDSVESYRAGKTLISLAKEALK